MSDIEKCKTGQHPFIVISKTEASLAYKVVRWCPECGAIVVDADYDNRTNAGYYRELQYPEIVKRNGLN